MKKYKFSFITNNPIWTNPRVDLSVILGEYYYEKAYNVKRRLIEKERTVHNWWGTKHVSYKNKWLMCFSINITPKDAFKLGEILKEKYGQFGTIKYA